MTLTPTGEPLTPEEEARCAAMAERAAMHAMEAEGFARQFAALRAKHSSVTEALALIVALHICERARCAALDCSAPTLEETLDRHEIICRAALAQTLRPLKEACN